MTTNTKIVLARGWVNNPEKYSQSIPTNTPYNFNVTVCLEYDTENASFTAISRDQDQWYGEAFPLEACEFQTTLVNCTPHDVQIHGESGEVWNIPASGIETRCREESVFFHYIGEISVMKTVYAEILNLPPRADGVYYIVSRLVLTALEGTRPDCVGVGKAVRNEKG